MLTTTTDMSFGGKSFKREELRLKQELQQLTRQSKHELAGLNTIDKSKFLESSSKTALAQRSQPTKHGGSHRQPKKSTKSKRRDTETRESDGEIPPPSPSIDLAPELRATPDSEHTKAIEQSHVHERRTSDLISRSTGIASIRSKVDLNVVMYGKGLGDESNLYAKLKEKVNYCLAQLRCQPFQEMNLMQTMYSTKCRETGGREGYGRWEKKGREEGSLRWREAGEKFKKAVKETNPTTFLDFHLTFSEA